MSSRPTLVWVPGAWHKATCFGKVLSPLRREHNLNCIFVTLPSTLEDLDSTFKEGVEAVRAALLSETRKGRDVVIIVHSYGSMVGCSAVKGLTLIRGSSSGDTASVAQREEGSVNSPGCVQALVIIASGFPFTGLAFMDPLFGNPLPFFRINKETGFADLTGDPHTLFYHDLTRNEADYWVSQLGKQSLISMFEGGNFVYAGWQVVPTWYVGTTEDRELPVLVQRVMVRMARGQGAVVHHAELKSSHSPFLSMPDEVVAVIVEVVNAVGALTKQTALQHEVNQEWEGERTRQQSNGKITSVVIGAPDTWLRFGIPLTLGRVIGWMA